MPPFSPSEMKTAIAPITAKPSGMTCEAELFLGPDETTKVAFSGRIPFVSTGAAKNVSLPITMPSAPGSYHGYIDVYTGGLRFLAYKTKEDVTIKSLALLSTSNWGNIEILNVDGQGFIEVSGNEAVLAEPKVVSRLMVYPHSPAVLLIRNLSLPAYSRWGNKAIQMRYQYKAAFPVSDPYDDAPQFLATIQLPAEVPMIYDPVLKQWVRDTSIEVLMTIRFGAWYGGWWRPGIYDAEFEWGLLDTAQQQYAPMGNNFIIRNMVRCTGTGSYNV